MGINDFDKKNGFGAIVKPGSRLLYTVSESGDYRNALKVSLRFERHTSTAVFPEYRDFIAFTDGDSAQEIINDLRDLADRLEKHCVKKLKDKPISEGPDL